MKKEDKTRARSETVAELKCDADGCDHVEGVDGLSEDLIDRQCPKCGASLLTQEDYEAALAMIPAMKAFKLINDAVADLAEERGLEVRSRRVSVNPRVGALNVSVEDVEEGPDEC